MKAAAILEAARDLVIGDRNRQHGDILLNHIAIAALWNGYLDARATDRPLTAGDVANMMELLKIARRLNGETNIDNFIDGAGYAALAGQIASGE